MTSPSRPLDESPIRPLILAAIATTALFASLGEASAQIRIVEAPPAEVAPTPEPAPEPVAPEGAAGTGETPDATDPPAESSADSESPTPAPEAIGEPSRLDAEQVAEADPLDGDPGDPGERGGESEASEPDTRERSGGGAVRLATPLPGSETKRPPVAAGPTPVTTRLTDATEEGAPEIKVPEVATTDANESPQTAKLRADIDRCLRRYSVQYENAATRSPWGMMHAFLPWGVDAQVIVGHQKVNSIGYLCWNGTCRKQRLFYQKNGEMGLFVGPGVQGHAGQFLAMLAQCRIDRTYEIRIDDYRYDIQDLIEYEKRTCVPKSELTFKLIGFSHYLADGDSWNNRHGKWNLERLVAEEIDQPIVGAACGGTHRLMGLSYAVRARKAHGRPIDGHFERARVFLADFQDYAMRLQNPDGSFSSEWFERRAADPDFDRKVQTTGHILEWLIYSLPEERLDDPRIVRSVRFIADALNEHPDYEFEVGPKGHALRALTLYQRMKFGGTYGLGSVAVASDQEPVVEVEMK